MKNIYGILSGSLVCFLLSAAPLRAEEKKECASNQQFSKNLKQCACPAGTVWRQISRCESECSKNEEWSDAKMKCVPKVTSSSTTATVTTTTLTTTAAPVTAAPVTAAPLTAAPLTAAPLTVAPVTAAPVTAAPLTAAPVTAAPVVTAAPLIPVPLTASPKNGLLK